MNMASYFQTHPNFHIKVHSAQHVQCIKILQPKATNAIEASIFKIQPLLPDHLAEKASNRFKLNKQIFINCITNLRES